MLVDPLGGGDTLWGGNSVLPESLVRFDPFCSGSWSLADSHARTVARSGLRSNYDRSCRVGGSDAALGSPAPAARTVARRRDALSDLRLSFVTHLRYTYARTASTIPTPSAARRLGVGRVGDDL